MKISAVTAHPPRVPLHRSRARLEWRGEMADEVAELKGYTFRIQKLDRLLWQLTIAGPTHPPSVSTFLLHPMARKAALNFAACL